MEVVATVKWYKSWWAKLLFFFLFIMSIVLVAFGLKVYQIYSNMKDIPFDPFKDTKKYENTDNGTNFSLGPENAKLTIVEFGDFSCPNSREEFYIIRELEQKYQDQVRLVFRDFPVISKDSKMLAQFARCVGEQGKFWPIHDKLYINQGVTESDRLLVLAKQAGADTSKVSKCMADNKYNVQIEKDASDAISFEVNGTPTWFFNGHKIEGNIPKATFEALIKTFLNK